MTIQRLSLQRMTAADLRAMCWLLQQPRAARRARLARAVSRLGDGPLYALLVLLLWWLGGQNGEAFAVSAALAYGIEVPAFMALKNIIKRPRPADCLDTLSAFIQPADRFSFPSGHTAAAFVMAILLALYYPALAAPALAFALLVGVSRVLLGVHYPTDIAAGSLLGTACALLALGLV